ncbi:MAG: hypothetical protein L0H15_05865, partial [Nitrosospira sp.]|nr:hypothetical protein [Nitrosospira sp.]
IERALSGTLFCACLTHGSVFIRFIGSGRRSKRLHPLYYKWFQASQVMREWGKGVLRRNVSCEDEGLGAAYDKRKWMEVYYGKSDK